MEQRNSLIVILLAAILGSAAIVPRSGGPTYTAPPPALSQSGSGSANAPTTPLRANTAQEIVREFFSDENYELDVAWYKAVSLGRLELLPDWKIDSLIATVPDPVESGLGSSFDDYVDSIEHALSAEDYVPDRFYDPWPLPSQLTKIASGSDGQTDSDDNSQAAEQHVPTYERKPGLILFRDNAQQRLLVVFLVGETPTTGVHIIAFEEALKQASELPTSETVASCAEGPDCPSNIKVMGPSFSGSAASIRLAIEEWSDSRPELAPKVEIISGAATAVDEKQFESQGVSYQTTIIPNSAEMEALLHWLGGQNVAFLSEDSTSFGVNSRTPYTRHRGTPNPLDKILSLQFPLHIAELQRAAERAMQTAKTEVSTPSLSNPNLPLDTHASRTRRDLLPLYSTAETNRVELVLDSNLQEINDHKIAYVIVAATDPADTLFLVHWIRQNCPKIIPVVLNADLLYLHTDVNADTRGMIVASTYPLYLENQLWTHQDRGPIQFSLNASEGIYNATLALLGDPSRLLDYTKPFPSGAQRTRCIRPSDAHPLWISLVGADQLWPLSIQDACVQADYMVAIPRTGGTNAAADDELKLYPKALTLMSLLIALGCVLICSLILGTDAWTSWLYSKMPGFIRQVLGPAVLPEYKGARRRATRLFSIVLLCVLATMAYYFFLPFRMGMAGELNGTWKFWTALVATSVVAFGLLGSLAPRSSLAKINPLWTGQPPWRTPSGRILSLLVLFPFVAVMVCMIVWLIPPADPAARLFLFLRTVDLGGKVSQLTPMLLTYAAAIALIVGALRRLALLESRQVLTPFLNFGTPSFKGFAELEQQVRTLVAASGWSWRSCAIAVTIVIAYWLAAPLHQLPQRDIDPPGFELLFFVVSLAVYIGIGLAIVKMVNVWLSVRRLLRRIYTHPSRCGYGAYRQQLHFLKEPAIDLLSRVPAMSQLEVALDQVRQLVITSDDTSARASAEIETRLDQERPWLGLLLPWAEWSINETEEAQANGEWSHSIRAKRQTEIWMAVLSWSIAYIFEPLWRTTNATRLPAPPAGAAPKESKPTDTIGEIYVASRVVDFLRQVMPQLESLALSATLAMLLMLFAVSSYPFPARDDLLWFSWFVVLATVGSMMWMFFSLNRDRVASMIAGTTPGQTDWNSTLVLQVATHALLPILVLLGAAFPTRLGAMVTWIGGLFGGRA